MVDEYTYYILADVANALESGLFAHLGAGGVGDVAHEDLNQVGPNVLRQLHHCDVLHALGRGRRPVALRAQRSEDVGLDVSSDVFRHGQPPLLVGRSDDVVVGCELVFELQAGLAPSHRRVTSMAEDVRQRLQQLGLQQRRVTSVLVTWEDDLRKHWVWHDEHKVAPRATQCSEV